MGDSVWSWPSADMDFWKINNEETSVIIKWSRNCFEDYKALSYHFYSQRKRVWIMKLMRRH